MEVKLPNTDWCNIAGEASDMRAEESLEVELPNTDWCNIAGEASDMQVEEIMEDKERIEQIRTLAHKVNGSVNLFQGYCPKAAVNRKGENLFWRKVVSIYGLFCDCDRVQIKAKHNLFSLFYEYALIDRKQYGNVKSFFHDISDLRGWFCHNNDSELYFAQKREKAIERLIGSAFTISSGKPRGIDDITDKDWPLMFFYIQAGFENYLDVLEQGLRNWGNSSEKEQIDTEWYKIFSEALFDDRELRNNVLANICQYQMLEQGLEVSNIGAVLAGYDQQLTDADYSVEDIEKVVQGCKEHILSSEEIIMKSLERIKLHI